MSSVEDMDEKNLQTFLKNYDTQKDSKNTKQNIAPITAEQFYRGLLQYGEWTLSQAANAFLGTPPHAKLYPKYNADTGAFEENEEPQTPFFGNPLPKNAGLVMIDPETYVRQNESGDMVDKYGSPVDDPSRSKASLDSFCKQTCLRDFVQGHINAGHLTPTSFAEDGEPKFPPEKIIKFLHTHFINLPPKALLIMLGLEQEEQTPPLNAEERVRHYAQNHAPEIINKYIQKHGKEPKKKAVTAALLRELPDIKKATIDRNYNFREMKREAAKLRYKQHTQTA